MGFAQESDEISPRPVCVLCNEVLHSTSSVSSKLNRPPEIQHSKHTCKPPSFFPRCVKQPIVSESIYHTEFRFENETVLMASMKFIYCITYEDEEHKMGKILVVLNNLFDGTCGRRGRSQENSVIAATRQYESGAAQPCAANVLDELAQRLR